MNASKYALLLFVTVALISCGKDNKNSNSVSGVGAGAPADHIYDNDEINRDLQVILDAESELANHGLRPRIDDQEPGFVHASWEPAGYTFPVSNDFSMLPSLQRYHQGLKKFVGKYSRFRHRGGNMDAQSIENLAQWRGKLQLSEESLRTMRMGRPVWFVRVTVRVR